MDLLVIQAQYSSPKKNLFGKVESVAFVCLYLGQGLGLTASYKKLMAKRKGLGKAYLYPFLGEEGEQLNS